MHRLSTRTLRFWLFTGLLLAAPLSKYPSVSFPLFNYTSFRIGLYQVMALSFVILCIHGIVKSTPRMFKQQRSATASIAVLAAVCLLGLATALYKARSLLIVSSILLLLGLLLSAWWYVSDELSEARYSFLLRSVLIAGCFYGGLSILLFLFAGFGHETFGLLCKGCGSQIFGFPRISGLAAEPQFHANALLIYLFLGLGSFYRKRSKFGFFCIALTLVGIGLTFSRGAFLAAGLGIVLFFVLLRVQKLVSTQTVAKHMAIFAFGGILVSGLFIGASAWRFRSTPDIAYKTLRSMVEQVSLGVIKLPSSSTQTGFQPAGLVQASGQERLDAAKLSLRAWGSNPYTVLFGVGAGNLGPYVNAHIDAAAPSNLTVYIYYILLLSELGVIGLAAYLLLVRVALISYLKRFWKNKGAELHTAIFCLGAAFLVQYCFFGSFINVAYIWLWFGIVLGLRRNKPRGVIIDTRL